MVASLLASRMAGTLAMSWWALAAAIIARDRLHLPVVTGSVVFAAVMIVAWIVALVSGVARERIPERFRLARAAGDLVRPLTRAFGDYRDRPHHTVGRSIAAGILAWGFNLFSLAAFSVALGAYVSWAMFALTLPVALLATFIPISANGIGVREGLVVVLLVQEHVAVTAAAALALFVDLQMPPFAMLGGFVHLVAHGRRRGHGQLETESGGPQPSSPAHAGPGHAQRGEAARRQPTLPHACAERGRRTGAERRRPASTSACRRRYSIWPLVLRRSSAAHRARALCTAGSRRRRTAFRRVGWISATAAA